MTSLGWWIIGLGWGIFVILSVVSRQKDTVILYLINFVIIIATTIIPLIFCREEGFAYILPQTLLIISISLSLIALSICIYEDFSSDIIFLLSILGGVAFLLFLIVGLTDQSINSKIYDSNITYKTIVRHDEEKDIPIISISSGMSVEGKMSLTGDFFLLLALEV